MGEKVEPQNDPTSPGTKNPSIPAASSENLRRLSSGLIEHFLRRVPSLVTDVLEARLLVFSLEDPDNFHLYDVIRSALKLDPMPEWRHFDDLRELLERDLSEKTPNEADEFRFRDMAYQADSRPERQYLDHLQKELERELSEKTPNEAARFLSNLLSLAEGTEVPAVAPDLSQPEATTQPTLSRYTFIPRYAVVSLCAAAAFWALIVALATLTTHTFPWPLAVIAGYGLLPLAISGGIRHRV